MERRITGVFFSPTGGTRRALEALCGLLGPAVLLELGAGMHMRELQVIRWPLEKTVFFNKKAHMYRINREFPQISDEIGEKAEAVRENSVEFVKNLC